MTIHFHIPGQPVGKGRPRIGKVGAHCAQPGHAAGVSGRADRGCSMTRCNRCGRVLKAPTPTGLGPKCALYVLGANPRRVAKVDLPVKRDELTRDLFGEAA